MATARRTHNQKKTAVPVSASTRDLLITSAERLFAEQGISASNRQIGEAAGQANNSVVGYHFGTKADLVVAIVRRHSLDIEQRRTAMLEGLSDTQDLRAWLECMVKPFTAHMDSLGTPSWFARFLAQAATDPAMRKVVIDEMIASPSMRATIEGLMRWLPVFPPQLHEERGDMTRYLFMHACAERERALHEGTPTPRATWDDAALGMVDALVGLWGAPFHETAPPTTGDNDAAAANQGRKDRT